jgi:hypothetical protein
VGMKRAGYLLSSFAGAAVVSLASLNIYAANPSARAALDPAMPAVIGVLCDGSARRVWGQDLPQAVGDSERPLTAALRSLSVPRRAPNFRPQIQAAVEVRFSTVRPSGRAQR